jgi:hypothetical protein
MASSCTLTVGELEAAAAWPLTPTCPLAVTTMSSSNASTVTEPEPQAHGFSRGQGSAGRSPDCRT